jgi:hypothetical protein
MMAVSMAIDSAVTRRNFTWNYCFVELFNSQLRVEENAFKAPQGIRQGWLENLQAA